MIFRKFFNKDADKIDYFTNELGLNRRVVELLLSRGIASKEGILEFLSPIIFHNPFSLKGMQELLDRVFLAKQLGDSVLIFGDYDVDELLEFKEKSGLFITGPFRIRFYWDIKRSFTYVTSTVIL